MQGIGALRLWDISRIPHIFPRRDEVAVVGVGFLTRGGARGASALAEAEDAGRGGGGLLRNVRGEGCLGAAGPSFDG